MLHAVCDVRDLLSFSFSHFSTAPSPSISLMNAA